MKDYLNKVLRAGAVFAAVMLASTIITACNGSADAATTGVTMAQVNAAIADAVAPHGWVVREHGPAVSGHVRERPRIARPVGGLPLRVALQ